MANFAHCDTCDEVAPRVGATALGWWLFSIQASTSRRPTRVLETCSWDCLMEAIDDPDEVERATRIERAMLKNDWIQEAERP